MSHQATFNPPARVQSLHLKEYGWLHAVDGDLFLVTREKVTYHDWESGRNWRFVLPDEQLSRGGTVTVEGYTP